MNVKNGEPPLSPEKSPEPHLRQVSALGPLPPQIRRSGSASRPIAAAPPNGPAAAAIKAEAATTVGAAVFRCSQRHPWVPLLKAAAPVGAVASADRRCHFSVKLQYFFYSSATKNGGKAKLHFGSWPL
ncbi:Uncharacterized protein Fot_42141 [Forsythia ovata]|uniref:Uncharacterized protein n=1 Tax=Forsythia ovata TaxID=205694 RepID=A0ABD1RLA9_9LAMI